GVERRFASDRRPRNVGAHCFSDCTNLLRHPRGHFRFVVAEIERHSQKWLTICIRVRRVEIEIVVLVRITATLRRDGKGMRIPCGVCLLPLRTPLRGSGWHAAVPDRPTVEYIG